jgi:hypothetical protein
LHLRSLGPQASSLCLSPAGKGRQIQLFPLPGDFADAFDGVVLVSSIRSWLFFVTQFSPDET